MSTLRSALNDPNNPSDSTLSFLLGGTGVAAPFFQREIFQHLNKSDAKNIRLANRRLNAIVRGEPLWEVQDAQGRAFHTTTPPHPNVPPVGNSTLHYLSPRCNGERFPGKTPCPTGPQTNVQIKYCTGVPPPLQGSPQFYAKFPCCRKYCANCVTSYATWQYGNESGTRDRAREVKLCNQCQLHEAKRHPLGASTCTCRSLLNQGWQCWACRTLTNRGINKGALRGKKRVSAYHRDRRGKKILALRKRPRAKMPCPGCARSFVDSAPGVINLPMTHVQYCASCDGIVVRPMMGANFKPTHLMPKAATRFSERLRKKYAAMPALNFQPDVMVP